MKRIAEIIGTGMYAPEKIVKNDYFNDFYKKDVDSFLREKRNIFERHFMADNQATSDLIIPAAQEALKNAGISAADLDLLIVSTDTPDYLSPSTASVVQFKLGAKNAGSFDVNSACSGFVTALDMAGKYIAADERYQHILVVGAYGMSKYLDWNDYKIASLFADGAGAVVVKAIKIENEKDAEPRGILAAQLYTAGQYHDYMGIYGGGTYCPITNEALVNRQHLLKFAKKIPIETNKTFWPKLTMALLDRIHRKPADIDHFFITQINIESINDTLDVLGLPHSKSHNIMDRYGYTGSACIPMAMADAVKQKKLNKGDLIFLVGSGGGMSMAALAMIWG